MNFTRQKKKFWRVASNVKIYIAPERKNFVWPFSPVQTSCATFFSVVYFLSFTYLQSQALYVHLPYGTITFFSYDFCDAF